MAQEHRPFIDGAFRDPEGDGRLEVINPATGAPVAALRLASTAQARAAVAAAARAQPAWGALPSIARGEALRRFAAEIDARADEIGAALASESGKSLADATAEARYAAEVTRYHAEWARRIEGEIIPSDNPGETLLLKRAPIGVVACLIPFNYPVYTLMRKIAPALIAGNAVLARPSSLTPLSAFVVARAAEAAGLPPGVFNLLMLDRAAARIMCEDPAVGMITLTGGLEAGRSVLEMCKANIARPSLELGGKTPVVIGPGADLDEAARRIAAHKTTHCGQLCTAASRVYVPKALEADLVARLKAAFAARRFGDRAHDPDAMGPLASAAARQEAQAMVGRALAGGAKLETGGYIPQGPGFFYPPTLLSGCRQEMEIIREECFAPVLPVVAVDSMDEALKLSNDHQFGLSAVLLTTDYATVMRFSDAVQAGELYINRFPSDPYQGFHAGWKRSGLGGDDGKYGMLSFTQTRLVVMGAS